MRIRRVLLDMDGVLADFARGVADRLRVPYPYKDRQQQDTYDLEPMYGVSSSAIWRCLDEDFWADLAPYPWTDAFIGALEQRFGEENVCLLTSPPSTNTAEAVAGKIKWIRKHRPRILRQRRFLIGPAKVFTVNQEHCLVDDFEKNISTFREAGGQTFLVPAAWNARFAEHPLQALEAWLSAAE